MNQELPSFRKPPVIETAVSVQFKPVHGLTNAHMGLFWHQSRDKYPKVVDAEPIPPQVELFGDQLRRTPRLPSFQIVAGQAAARLQMLSENDEAMVQIQNGRLVFNWRRGRGGEYPRWGTVLPQFGDARSHFDSFLAAQGLKGIEPNQWEVTYVNHLSKGSDWEQPSDWPKVIPGLFGPATTIASGATESVGCNYRFLLPQDGGRLYVEAFHGFTGLEPDAKEILILQLTARGAVAPARGQDLIAGLEKGHDAIVRTFTEVTGPEAHKKWERER